MMNKNKDMAIKRLANIGIDAKNYNDSYLNHVPYFITCKLISTELSDKEYNDIIDDLMLIIPNTLIKSKIINYDRLNIKSIERYIKTIDKSILSNLPVDIKYIDMVSNLLIEDPELLDYLKFEFWDFISEDTKLKMLDCTGFFNLPRIPLIYQTDKIAYYMIDILKSSNSTIIDYTSHTPKVKITDNTINYLLDNNYLKDLIELDISYTQLSIDVRKKILEKDIKLIYEMHEKAVNKELFIYAITIDPEIYFNGGKYPLCSIEEAYEANPKIKEMKKDKLISYIANEMIKYSIDSITLEEIYEKIEKIKNKEE